MALEVCSLEAVWKKSGPKIAPRGPQDAPRRLQDASRRPKTPLKPPKTPQRRPQEAPRCLQEASRGLQEASRRLQEAPRRLQKVPRRLRDPRGTSKNSDFPLVFAHNLIDGGASPSCADRGSPAGLSLAYRCEAGSAQTQNHICCKLGVMHVTARGSCSGALNHVHIHLA